MIRLQSSMSNHIPVSAARPRPPPWPLAPVASRLPLLSSPISSMLSRCSVARAAPATSGFSKRRAAAPDGRAAGEPSPPGCGTARSPSRRRPSPAPACWRPLFPPPPRRVEVATSPRLLGGPARAQSGFVSSAAACPARRPGLLAAGLCSAESAGPGWAARREGRRGRGSAPWAVPGAPCRVETEPGGGSGGQDGSA